MQPIAPRAGRPAPPDMRADLALILRTALVNWLTGWLVPPRTMSPGAVEATIRGFEQRALMVATALDLHIGNRVEAAYDQVRAYAKGDEELLDVVHVTLNVIGSEGVTYRNPPYEEVARILAFGRSAWTANDNGLVRRADPTAQAAMDQATATPDSASTELVEAWIQAHDRAGDPGDAWDHSIKAVEAALIPVVVPNKNKPNLGDVIGQLRGQPHLWKLGIRGQNRDNGVEPLVAMLTLLWPDPNRHGSPTPEAPATPEEGRALVNVAVTVVQWARDGLLTRR